jgi:hypothetical protein
VSTEQPYFLAIVSCKKKKNLEGESKDTGKKIPIFNSAVNPQHSQKELGVKKITPEVLFMR